VFSMELFLFPSRRAWCARVNGWWRIERWCVRMPGVWL